MSGGTDGRRTDGLSTTTRDDVDSVDVRATRCPAAACRSSCPVRDVSSGVGNGAIGQLVCRLPGCCCCCCWGIDYAAASAVVLTTPRYIASPSRRTGVRLVALVLSECEAATVLSRTIFGTFAHFFRSCPDNRHPTVVRYAPYKRFFSERRAYCSMRKCVRREVVHE